MTVYVCCTCSWSAAEPLARCNETTIQDYSTYYDASIFAKGLVCTAGVSHARAHASAILDATCHSMLRATYIPFDAVRCCFQALVLCYEDAPLQDQMPYLTTRLAPMAVLEFTVRSAKGNSPCRLSLSFTGTRTA